MDTERLQAILARFNSARILVIGDYFLDRYLILDAALSETSLETGLEAYQVTRQRLSPGAAGTVTANLKALDAGTVYALGMVGADGEGFALRNGLEALGIVTDLLVETDERFTPTYTKPMLLENGVERELNRIDTKNRQACPPAVERTIVEHLRQIAPLVDAVVIADQVQERNCGVVTDTVREELSHLARKYEEKVFIVDSRLRVGEYRGCWLKPNRAEAYRALGKNEPENEPTPEAVALEAATLRERCERPVLVTLGAGGSVCVTATGATHLPIQPQQGPIDICGAGDSVMAGCALALCAGALPEEAALIGNLAASLTIQQIGVTGATSREAIRERFAASGAFFQPRPLSSFPN